MLEWVDWFNFRRLLEPIDNIPPAEYHGQTALREQEALKEVSLHQSRRFIPSCRLVVGNLGEAAAQASLLTSGHNNKSCTTSATRQV